jgi:serine/threonine-protein kinase
MSSQIFKRGDVCGGYQVLELMGCGGIAEVYKALNLSSQEIVALKVLRPCHAQNGYVREHMLAEAELLSKMSHANVVRVEDVGMDADLLWMAMEYLPGVTLRSLLKASGPLAIPTALYYAREIADGVSAAHEMGVIHRDLKPENVIITEQHKVKVLDMGAAKFYGWNVKDTVKGSIFGTPLYMSPEHIRQEAIDARSDVYSLGIMLYEMIVGFHPFAQGDNGPLGKYEVCERQLNVAPPPLATVREGVPEELSELVRRATAKDRNERPSTIREFAQAMRAILRTIVSEGAFASLHDIPLASASGAGERGADDGGGQAKSEGNEPAPARAALDEGAGEGDEDEEDLAPTRVFKRPDITAPILQQDPAGWPGRGYVEGASPPRALGAHGTEIMQVPWYSAGAAASPQREYPVSPQRERLARRPESTGSPSHGLFAFAGLPGEFSLPGLGALDPRRLNWLFRSGGSPSDTLRRDCVVERALRTLLGALMAALGIAFVHSWLTTDRPADRVEELYPELAQQIAGLMSAPLDGEEEEGRAGGPEALAGGSAQSGVMNGSIQDGREWSALAEVRVSYGAPDANSERSRGSRAGRASSSSPTSGGGR